MSQVGLDLMDGVAPGMKPLFIIVTEEGIQPRIPVPSKYFMEWFRTFGQAGGDVVFPIYHLPLTREQLFYCWIFFYGKAQATEARDGVWRRIKLVINFLLHCLFTGQVSLHQMTFILYPYTRQSTFLFFPSIRELHRVISNRST
jgi:hypothetical protein